MSLPVTILGGYLGSGKTTLVNHLLRSAAGRRIAVLVNEFGSVPIDTDLIEGADGGVLTLAGGCICCSYGDDLVAALQPTAARGDRIDHVLIEASGVALPGAIARSLGLLPGLELDAVVVLADAETIAARAADPYMGDTITRQLADADIVVLNKLDLVSHSAVEQAAACIARHAADARILAVANAAVPVEIVLGTRAPGATAGATAGVAGAAGDDTRPAAPPDGRDPPAPMPAGARHTAGLDSFSIAIDGPLDISRLAAALAGPDAGLVRAKGFMLDRDGAWCTLQIVGRRFAVGPAPSTAVTHAQGRLVAIAHGRRVDRNLILAALAAARSWSGV
jgi:G3E family GTPase